MLSLLEALSSGSKDYSDSPVWTFLNDHGDPVDSYTYLVRLMFLIYILLSLITSNLFAIGL